MLKASDFGFYPGNTGEANSIALQKAVDCGGEIFVDGKGIADIRESIRLGDNVTLRFENGLKLRRIKCPTHENGYAFVNKGAFDGTTNTDITIDGLYFITNGMICGNVDERNACCIPGLRGCLAFLHVKNLTVRNVTCMDVADFFLQICTFENVLIENIHLEGFKDGIHFGRGKKFAVRHGIFRTYDDPIALNAHDYSNSNPELGWIEDGVIEDCYDLNDKDTVGYFARILAGAWLDWTPGMVVRHSDTVVYNNRLYRVYMDPNGKEYISNTPPTHTEGSKEYDGILWCMTQEGAIYNCGCRNIVFRDIFLYKDRPYAFSLHFDNDNYSHSVYPGAKMPVQEDIYFDHIVMHASIDSLFYCATPTNHLYISNSVMDGTRIELDDIKVAGCEYGCDDFIFNNVSFNRSGEQLMIETKGSRRAKIRTCMSHANDTFVPVVRGNVDIGINDIGIIRK